jgi:hypothetical protein
MNDIAEAGRREFGIDVDAALACWGGYEGFPEGVELTHQVLREMNARFGSVLACWVIPSNGYVAVRFNDLGPTAVTCGWGYVYVTPPAINAAGDRGIDLVAELSAVGLVGDFDDGGLTVWTSRGLRDRARPTFEEEPSGRLCANRDCDGAHIRQGGDLCSYCETPLA